MSYRRRSSWSTNNPLHTGLFEPREMSQNGNFSWRQVDSPKSNTSTDDMDFDTGADDNSVSQSASGTCFNPWDASQNSRRDAFKREHSFTELDPSKGRRSVRESGIFTSDDLVDCVSMRKSDNSFFQTVFRKAERSDVHSKGRKSDQSFLHSNSHRSVSGADYPTGQGFFTTLRSPSMPKKQSPSSLLSMLNISESVAGRPLPPINKSRLPSYMRLPSFHSDQSVSMKSGWRDEGYGKKDDLDEIEVEIGVNTGSIKTGKRKSLGSGSENGDTFDSDSSMMLNWGMDISKIDKDNQIKFSCSDPRLTSEQKANVSCNNNHAKMSRKHHKSEPKSHKNKATNETRGLRMMLFCALAALIAVLSYQYSPPRHICIDSLNVTDIEYDLAAKVYGQHLAVEVISASLREFFSPGSYLSNLLVLSFHGWTGIGKNHVSNIIANHVEPHNLHRLIIPLHFPHSSEEDEMNLRDWMLGNVSSNCGVELFVIDEIDKAGGNLIGSLHEVLKELAVVLKDSSDRDSDRSSNQYGTSKVIILLLSNTDGATINSYTVSTLNSGLPREDIKYNEILSYLHESEPKLWYTSLAGTKLIDYIVPFLPLERRHVAQCTIEAFKSRGVEKVDDKLVDMVLDQLSYFPRDAPLFSTAGCRRVPSQVNLMLG